MKKQLELNHTVPQSRNTIGEYEKAIAKYLGGLAINGGGGLNGYGGNISYGRDMFDGHGEFSINGGGSYASTPTLSSAIAKYTDDNNNRFGLEFSRNKQGRDNNLRGEFAVPRFGRKPQNQYFGLSASIPF